MFSIVGWKRLEVNRMMVFAGIMQANFQSVMRRSLVWKPKARFHPDAVLKQAHADHELDGHFLPDPSLKQFLISAPACVRPAFRSSMLLNCNTAKQTVSRSLMITHQQAAMTS